MTAWLLVLGLALRVTPTVAFAPATIASRVRIDPAPENRLLRLALVSADWYQESERDLEGATAPTTIPHLVPWKDVPAGDYIVVAELVDVSGKVIATATRPVHVVAPFGQ